MINSFADKIVLNALKLIKFGQLRVINHDKREYLFGEENKDLKVVLKINSKNFNSSILKKGSVGLAEAYMCGDIETNNLSDLIELTARNISIIHKFSGILDFTLINNIKGLFIKNTKSQSKKNILKHYDLGNEFFSLWLDKSLTYSSAIFDNDEKDLEAAQLNKYKKLINLIKPKSGDKILEIGCGWGGFAEYIGKNFDVKLDCITISKKQFDYTKKRIQKNGLNEKINISMRDYRDVKNQYNSIASIEMIEAVGKNYLKNYFKTIKKNLSPQGIAAIQAITIDDKLYERYATKQDFIQKYIFPGGLLPSKNKLIELSELTGLKISRFNSYGLHYSNTLQIWKKEFQKKWDLISDQGFDQKFKRMWNFYLSYCEAGFKSRNIDLIQFSLQSR